MDRIRVVIEGWGVLLGVPALFLAAYFYPQIPVVSAMSLCTVRRFLGVVCPGCGLKSSFIALMHGQVRASVDAHPLGIVIALWLGWLFLRAVGSIAVQRPLAPLLTQRSRDWLVGAFLAALLGQWVARLALS